MSETGVIRPPTAANMRLDGGHPALELVNTVYGQVDGPVEHDVLATPDDLVTLARRVALAGPETPAAAAALADARALRDAVDALLRAHLANRSPPAGAVAALEAGARRAVAAARLAPGAGAFEWSWPPDDAHTPVHRFALAALELLTGRGRARPPAPVRRLLLALPRPLARRRPALVLDGRLRHGGQEAALRAAPPRAA